MSTTTHIDVNADPEAHISIDGIPMTSLRPASIRVTVFHGDDSTFIWLTPEQARVIRGGIGVALDTLDFTFEVPPNAVLGGE